MGFEPTSVSMLNRAMLTTQPHNQEHVKYALRNWCSFVVWLETKKLTKKKLNQKTNEHKIYVTIVQCVYVSVCSWDKYPLLTTRLLIWLLLPMYVVSILMFVIARCMLKAVALRHRLTPAMVSHLTPFHYCYCYFTVCYLLWSQSVTSDTVSNVSSCPPKWKHYMLCCHSLVGSA